MDFIERIESIINSSLLNDGFLRIPLEGATDKMIEEEEKKLNRPLSEYHKILLKKWNGANLDFIRVYGVHKTENEFIKELAIEYQEWIEEIINEIEGNPIFFADDVAGFMYFELEDGRIVHLDSEFTGLYPVANDMSDFFLNYLFGERADEYMGKEWKQKLKEASIIK